MSKEIRIGTCVAAGAPAPAGVWAEMRPAGDQDPGWGCCDVSGDGSVLTAGVWLYGRLYLSTDSGATWAETRPAGDATKMWRFCPVSDDGAVMLAGVEGGRLYLSTNGGANWVEQTPGGSHDHYWKGGLVSGDGTVLLTGADNDRLFLSTDGGANWIEARPAGDVNATWRGGAASDDGSVLIVGTMPGRLYLSVDTGANWAEVQPAGDYDMNWGACAVSDDGAVLLAGASIGQLWLSTDGGANWGETQPDGPGQTQRYWNCVAADVDGSTLMAGVYGAPPGGYLYTSRDSGATWAVENVVGGYVQCWADCALNSDGEVRLAGVYGGRLWRYGGGVAAPTSPSFAVSRDSAGILIGVRDNAAPQFAVSRDAEGLLLSAWPVVPTAFPTEATNRLYPRLTTATGVPGTPPDSGEYLDLTKAAHPNGADWTLFGIASTPSGPVSPPTAATHWKRLSDGMSITWVSPPVAGFTCSGTISAYWQGREQDVGTKAGAYVRVGRLTPAGNFTWFGSFAYDGEISSSGTSHIFTISPTSTVFASGDRIVLEIYLEDSRLTPVTAQKWVCLGPDDLTYIDFTETIMVAV